MDNEVKKKVFVGLSGGVDSSVTAAVLLEQGYDVTGVFIRTWQPEWLECNWRADRRDAMRVCATLGIPFQELDLEDIYKQQVADYMINEYRQGRTPNPDVMCNRAVKFGGFLQWALRQGADYVATGHYARTDNSRLMRGVDTKKDQSYFLWTLTPKQLKHILFPVGHLPKTEVRKLAEKYGLPTARKKDSQGVCFLGKIDMKDFLHHYIDERPGDVLNEKGEIIGHHSGALFFTLGERHGFTITTKGTNDKPYYVVAKDTDKNTLTVAHTQKSQEQKLQSVVLAKVNDIMGVLQDDYVCQAEIRYHGTPKKCSIVSREGDNMIINFDHTDHTVAAGQSIVFYQNDVCLGGGIVQ